MNLHAFQVLDSRGVPTVCAVLTTKKGTFTATVPSGTSSGKYEALELRDSGRAFGGKGVLKACRNAENISKKLPIASYLNQADLDSKLIKFDGTANKTWFGANALLAISLVSAKAAAVESNHQLFSYFASLSNCKPQLPLPMATVIDGGKHAGNNLSLQELMLVPTKFNTFAAATQAVAETYAALRGLLLKKFGVNATNVGLEGGFAPPLKKTTSVLELLEAAIDAAGYSGKVKIALDCAASEFYNEKAKRYSYEGKTLTSRKLTEIYFDLLDAFPIVSIEDPFAEEDWSAFSQFTAAVGKKVKVVGDDLLTTNTSRITSGVLTAACNALLLKPNQIGTITETLEAAELARNAGWAVIASHRSGDSEDTFLADLAVGLGCQAAKIGAPCRSERTAKYNRLLFIEKFHKVKLAKWA